MKILKSLFGKNKTGEPIQTEQKESVYDKPKKLTKVKEKEFFKLVMDEEVDYSERIKQMLQEFPLLANSTVSGMKKGIDGFSSLMLAIRFYNFDVAKVLIQQGADVNFIDSSGVRQNHSPIFFDFMEMMRNIIEEENFNAVENGFKLWDLLDSNGLDYTIKSIVNDGVNRSNNFIEAYIRLIGAKYGNNHLVHNETTYAPPNPMVNIYRLSTESKNKKKESCYTLMAQRIIENINIDLLKEVDANQFRSWSSAILPFYIENGFVDNYSLLVVNKLSKEKYGFNLKNIDDINYLTTTIDKNINHFTNNEYGL